MLVELGKLAAGSLLLVVALGVGVHLLRREARAAGARHLTLVGTLPLGPGKSVHLVRVLDQVYLLGCADRAITLLGRLPPERTAAFLRTEAAGGRSRKERRGAPRGDFHSELRQALAGRER